MAMEQGVTFGGYRFDVGSGRLWHGAREVRLTPKASAVLRVLVGRPGEPVTKEQLFESVWNDTVVSDDALTSCIQELRRALEDDARQPRFIETRHRRGYRFVAALTPIVPAVLADATMPPPDASAIAVLPFADMSPGRDQDYFCEGIAEELINALAQIDGLRVASRTASFQFRDPGADIRVVGEHLQVGTLLEGSVRKAENRLRVTVQLIDVSTGFHQWSQRFDRTLDDVFAIQDEIAERVATLLRGDVLSGREKRAIVRPQTATEAYEYYLRGRQYLPRMTRPDLDRSRELFERALALDDRYGPAWACLAAAHATLYEWFGGAAEDLARAERASRAALEVAPDLALAHVARGFVLSLSGRYEEGVPSFEEAIRLSPNLFEGYYYFARASFAQGEIARSADLFGRAADLRQEDFQSLLLQSQSLRISGRDAESRRALKEGIRRAEHTLRLNPVDPRALSLGACALADDGQPDRALEWSQRALQLYPDDASTLFNAVCLYAKLRRKADALAVLERAFARGFGKRDWIEHDPDYDILRDDPRFQALLARLV